MARRGDRGEGGAGDEARGTDGGHERDRGLAGGHVPVNVNAHKEELRGGREAVRATGAVPGRRVRHVLLPSTGKPHVEWKRATVESGDRHSLQHVAHT